MEKRPTPAEEFRTELDRRGIHPTPEVREWARQQLADARAAWPAERFAALRKRSKRAAQERFPQHADSLAA